MTLSQGKSGSSLGVRFEELVGEMLREERKHQAGSLRVWNELSSHQKLLG